MEIEKIRELVHAVPFQPFALSAAGGTPVHVAHPDFIALAPNGRTILVYGADGGSHSLLTVPLISQVDVHDAASNGS